MADPYLSEIRIVAFTFAPTGWAACNGQVLPINQNQALFALLGTTYGGNGTTTFALPDLRGRVPIHFGAGFVQGQQGGETAHTLLTSEMPAHTHTANASSQTPNATTPANAIWAAVGSNPYAGSGSDAMNAAATTAVGGSQPHNNLQPFLGLLFVMAMVGIFPSRN